MIFFYREKNLFTGTPAVQGDDAVAALDKELVDPYRLRLGNDVSLNVSDGAVGRKS